MLVNVIWYWCHVVFIQLQTVRDVHSFNVHRREWLVSKKSTQASILGAAVFVFRLLSHVRVGAVQFVVAVACEPRLKVDATDGVLTDSCIRAGTLPAPVPPT